jgi:hypothetical protein
VIDRTDPGHARGADEERDPIPARTDAPEAASIVNTAIEDETSKYRVKWLVDIRTRFHFLLSKVSTLPQNSFLHIADANIFVVTTTTTP